MPTNKDLPVLKTRRNPARKNAIEHDREICQDLDFPFTYENERSYCARPV